MCKGQLLVVKGSICNIPISKTNSNSKSLPRPTYSDEIIVLFFFF